MMATYMIEVMKRKVAMEEEQFPATMMH